MTGAACVVRSIGHTKMNPFPAGGKGKRKSNKVQKIEVTSAQSTFGICLDSLSAVKGGLLLRKKPLECLIPDYTNSASAIDLSHAANGIARIETECAGVAIPRKPTR